MAAGNTIESVLGHHVQALMSGNVDECLKDYAEDAVVFSPNGAFKGHESIRACFTGVMGMLTPEVMSQMKLIKQSVDGDYVYVFWSAGPKIPLGSDTFCIRDGKIVMQSFVAQINP